MPPRDWKLQEIRIPKSVQQIRWFDLDPAMRCLDGDFPRRYGADKDSIAILDQLPHLDRQGTDRSPQRNLSIEQ
jgi:hypothetical protein